MSAITITPVGTGPWTKSWNVTASADGDIAATITHGFVQDYNSVAPKFVFLVPLLTNFYAKEWFLASITTTEILLTASSVASSGSATPQVQVIAMLPYAPMD